MEEDIAGKYLAKDEILRFSNARRIRHRICSLLAAGNILSRYADEFNLEIKKFLRNHPSRENPQRILDGSIIVELKSYYWGLMKLFKGTKYYDSLPFPSYFIDRSHSEARGVFAHLENNSDENIEKLNEFDKKVEGMKGLIKDFVDFDPIAQKAIIELNKDIIYERMTDKEKKRFFPKGRDIQGK